MVKKEVKKKEKCLRCVEAYEKKKELVAYA